MSRNSLVFLILAVLFIIIVVVASLFTGPAALPFSSLSNEAGGTKAAYLLLDELGFQVRRNLAGAWSGEGTLLALGPDYLQAPEEALVLADDYRFTNAYIGEYAYEFVQQMWPYREQVIYFEEYGRTAVPQSGGTGDTAITLADITPLWLRLLLVNLLAGVLFVLLFYRQRLGEPLPAAEFSGRQPLEGVYAMAEALRKSHLYADCLAYYYRYLSRGGQQWDAAGHLEKALGQVTSEREALALMRKMDETIKEYKHESK